MRPSGLYAARNATVPACPAQGHVISPTRAGVPELATVPVGSRSRRGDASVRAISHVYVPRPRAPRQRQELLVPVAASQSRTVPSAARTRRRRRPSGL